MGPIFRKNTITGPTVGKVEFNLQLLVKTFMLQLYLSKYRGMQDFHLNLAIQLCNILICSLRTFQREETVRPRNSTQEERLP